LKKLSFTWSLNAPALQTKPFWVHTAVPHFHSSVRSGAASKINLRSRASILPRQSPNSAIREVIRCEAFELPFSGVFFMWYPAVSITVGNRYPIQAGSCLLAEEFRLRFPTGHGLLIGQSLSSRGYHRRQRPLPPERNHTLRQKRQGWLEGPIAVAEKHKNPR